MTRLESSFCLLDTFGEGRTHLMDWILTQQFEKVLTEYRLLDEVRNCIDGILTQLELKEKDSIM